jgi:E3 ubiquitin-protein ligase UBR7
MPGNAPCTLRLNSKTGQKGDVTGEAPAKSNKYNQNFKNRFCGCGEDYDAQQEKGTMYQCLGLGTVDEGGCGEDWWHPECLVGFTREEYAKLIEKPETNDTNGTGTNTELNEEAKMEEETTTATPALNAVAIEHNGMDGNDVAAEAEQVEDEDSPLPPGFPPEDDFDHFLCYKCVEANPWIKKYAGSSGFLPPVYTKKELNGTQPTETITSTDAATNGDSKKRKAFEDDEDEHTDASLSVSAPAKRQKSEDPSGAPSSIPEDTTTSTLPITSKKEDTTTCRLASLPPLPTLALTNPFSLFLKPDFRDHLCRCPEHFPLLKPHPQLLEEEDTYEPPISEDGDEGAQSVGTGSILDRGEAAFNNMDRVRAIQGAMAYAQLKDKVSAFLKPFAESGKAVGAEDVKAYFEKLRGDAQGIEEAAVGAKASKKDEEGDGGADRNNRKEQSGY